MKIIATADVHLGMKFSSYAVHQAELAEERFRSLERVVGEGNHADAELLVIAGDLFHRVAVSTQTIERAAAIIDSFAGAVALVLPGNHDYLAPEGDRLWSAFRDAAGDRTLVLDRAGAFDLAPYDVPVRVLAAPCDALHGSTHRLGWAADEERGQENLVLGVAHGSIDGLTLDAEGHYFPMEHRFLASLPADLWVVGHTHRQHNDREARLVVPGTPEADGFDAPEPGVAALIVLDESGYELERVSTGRFQFAERTVRVEDPRGEQSQDELAGAVEAVLPDGEALVRLAVSGTLADEAFGRWNAVRESLLQDGRIVRITDDGLQRVLTQEDVDRRYATGSFAHRLLERLVAAEDHEALGEALSIVEEVSE